MLWYILWLLATIVNTLLIITIVDVVLMGAFALRFSGKCSALSFVITKENRIDMQKENECAGYAAAYILRHYDMAADGEEIYKKIPNKMADGYVYPKEIRRTLEGYGFSVKYCAGNLNALKNEVSKGNPVIVFIKVKEDKSWLHYVPVVGYDEKQIFLAESLTELVNCDEKMYNRRIKNEEFERLWNTSMLKMPLYSHTFFVVERKSL